MFPLVSYGHIDPGVAVSFHRRLSQAPVIPRYCAEDTTFVIGNKAGETKVFWAPAGSRIIIDVPGIHYNRKDWLVP